MSPEQSSAERWKPVVGHEGRYEVSDIGRVRNSRTGRVLKPKPAKGYHTVYFYRDGKAYCNLVHRLVLAAFVGPCPTDMEACHNNGVRDDNRVSNLRWDTRSGNARDRSKHGTQNTFVSVGKSHCIRGHEFTPENTIVRDLRPNDDRRGRECRQCARMHWRNYSARLRNSKAVSA